MASGLRTAVLVAFFALASGCGNSVSPGLASPSPTQDVVPNGPVVISLGIYSGRPDPVWTLTGEEAAGLDAALAALPDSAGTPPVGGLGYHGFTISRPASTSVAYRGVVAAPGEGRRAMKTDPTRTVERYLLQTSRPHVTQAEYAAAELAIGAP